MRSVAGVVAWLVAAWAAAPVCAQTVDDIADRGLCSTAGLEGISAQLAEAQMCLTTGDFVRFAPYPGITLESSRVHPYLQAPGRDAVQAAARSVPLQINSAFRTLADQYVLYYSGGCGLAAMPGRSNHQSGRAIDVQNYSAARTALEANGCTWFGSGDPVHFDCPGVDRRSDSVLTFQKLWNRNHPEDPIAEDGSYGPETETRLALSPAAGFVAGGCDCTPMCDGNNVVAGDCTVTNCGALTCDDSGGSPRCIDPSMPDPDGGVVPPPTDGGGPPPPPDEQCRFVGDGETCIDDFTIGVCVDSELFTTVDCPSGCASGACLPDRDGAIGRRDGGPGLTGDVSGCGCQTPGRVAGGAPIVALLILALCCCFRRVSVH